MSTKRHCVCPHCLTVNAVAEERLADHPKCGQCSQPLFEGQPYEVNEAQFNKVIAKDHNPVVVDFWASWCGPCKMMAPNFKQAAAQLEPYARLLKVSTETEQNLAGRMRIQSIPTLAIFKNGKEIARQAGAMGANDLVNWVKSQM